MIIFRWNLRLVVCLCTHPLVLTQLRDLWRNELGNQLSYTLVLFIPDKIIIGQNFYEGMCFDICPRLDSPTRKLRNQQSSFFLNKNYQQFLSSS